LAAVLNDFEQYPITPSMNVAIIGTGNLAYLTAQVLRAMGVNYVVIARRGSAKAKYFRAIGAKILFEDEVNDYIARNTPEGQGFDATFEVSGNAEVINTAINITRPRGFIHLKSTPCMNNSPDPLALPGLVLHSILWVLGSLLRQPLQDRLRFPCFSR